MNIILTRCDIHIIRISKKYLFVSTNPTYPNVLLTSFDDILYINVYIHTYRNVAYGFWNIFVMEYPIKATFWSNVSIYHIQNTKKPYRK